MHPENVTDIQMFEKKIEESKMNETARKEAEKVLGRMKQEGQDGHEYGMLYDYLDFLTSLSWEVPESSPVDLDEAQRILDEDHYGLKKVKERIIQQIAVMSLNKETVWFDPSVYRCTGNRKDKYRTEHCQSLGRSYARTSLGGVRDEAEIRGHRRDL